MQRLWRRETEEIIQVYTQVIITIALNSDVLQQENRQLSEPNLHQTTLPIDLKASVSQLVALELTKHSEDSKIHNKALAWLKSPPTATQSGWVITAPTH